MTSALMPPDAPATGKRIVLHHPHGLFQILGVLDDTPKAFVGADAGILINGRPTAIHLVAIHPTYYLYTPLRMPALVVAPPDVPGECA